MITSVLHSSLYIIKHEGLCMPISCQYCCCKRDIGMCVSTNMSNEEGLILRINEAKKYISNATPEELL